MQHTLNSLTRSESIEWQYIYKKNTENFKRLVVSFMQNFNWPIISNLFESMECISLWAIDVEIN